MRYVEVWRATHAHNMYCMVGEVFQDIDVSNLKIQLPEDLENDDEEMPFEWIAVRDDSEVSLPNEISLFLANLYSILETTADAVEGETYSSVFSDS